MTKDINLVPDQGHAEQQRIFNNETEAEIKDTIIKHVDNGLPVNYPSLLTLMMNVHQKNLEENKDIPILKRQEDFNDIRNIIFLICDSFPTHHDKTSASVAEQCNIELIQIPPGCTDECQHLDRRVFGSMKQQAKAHTSKEIGQASFNSMDPTTPDLQYKSQTKLESCKLLINI